jgi:hypothetical protein
MEINYIGSIIELAMRRSELWDNFVNKQWRCG